MKLRCIEKYFANVTYGKVYDVIKKDNSYIWIMNDKGQEHQFDTIESYFEILTDKTPSYYNNEKGSLYKFAEDHGLNAYEFEIVKRIVRCRKKKEFITDIEKTKFLLDLYMKEQGEKYKDETEQLNK
jgi:hypothetical protein